MTNPFKYIAEKFKRGFYEGGKVTAKNKDFWDANSSFEATAAPDRSRLTARARHLSANDAIMDNIDNAILNNVIGTGIELQSITGKNKFDADVEERFKRWATRPDLTDAVGRNNFSNMQRIILKTRMVDGEIFINKVITKDGLRLHLIEQDALDASRQDGGVELDNLGKVVRYHFRDDNNKAYTIPASNIIHYYVGERATQYRGISEYKQSILNIKNFSAFQTASIQSARARANIAYAIKQGGDPSLYGGDLANKIQSINGTSVLYLNQGDSIDKLDPDSVATDYVQFSENTIRLIATARKVSYELAFRDYSKVNFASSRASLLQDFKRFDFEQTHLRDYVLNPIYSAWLEVEILAGRIKASGYEKDATKWDKPKWIYPKRDLVDPLKEITALEKKVKLNITTESDIANSEGEDYEDILRKKAKEMELKAKYGIPDVSFADNVIISPDGTVSDGLDTNMTGSENNK